MAVDDLVPQWTKAATIHYSYVIMTAMASQITSIWIVYSSVCPGADQRKHQSTALLAFVRGIRRWPVNYPHKGPVTRKMLPFDDVIMQAIDLVLSEYFALIYEQSGVSSTLHIHREWLEVPATNLHEISQKDSVEVSQSHFFVKNLTFGMTAVLQHVTRIYH